jgi:hypothetical protein
MNDRIATAFLTTLAGAMVVGILYIVFVPIPEGPVRNSKEAAEAERVRATVTCIEHSGASKERDYRMAGYKAAKCAEQGRNRCYLAAVFALGIHYGATPATARAPGAPAEPAIRRHRKVRVWLAGSDGLALALAAVAAFAARVTTLENA